MGKGLILLIGIFVIITCLTIFCLFILYISDKINWNRGYCRNCHTKWKPDSYMVNSCDNNDYGTYTCDCPKCHKIQLYFTRIPLIIGGNNNENKKDKRNPKT